MPRLTKTETYAIRWLAEQGKTPEQISEELNLPDKKVKNVLEKSHKSSSDKKIKTATSKANTSSKDLMITKTANKRINSVAIMTKEASEVADANRQSTNNTTIQRSLKNAIYRPNSNK